VFSAANDVFFDPEVKDLAKYRGAGHRGIALHQLDRATELFGGAEDRVQDAKGSVQTPPADRHVRAVLTARSKNSGFQGLRFLEAFVGELHERMGIA
jgi:hypothetical protein